MRLDQTHAEQDPASRASRICSSAMSCPTDGVLHQHNSAVMEDCKALNYGTGML